MEKSGYIAIIVILSVAVAGSLLTLFFLGIEHTDYKARILAKQDAVDIIDIKYERCISDKGEISTKLVKCLEGIPAKEEYKDCCVRCMQQTVSVIRSLSEDDR